MRIQRLGVNAYSLISTYLPGTIHKLSLLCIPLLTALQVYLIEVRNIQTLSDAPKVYLGFY